MNMGNGINIDAGNFTLETYVRINPNGATNYPLLAGKLVSGNFLDRGFESYRPGQMQPTAARRRDRANGRPYSGLPVTVQALPGSKFYRLIGR